MNRTCPNCQQSRDIEDFAWKNKQENRRHPHCNLCRLAGGDRPTFADDDSSDEATN